MRKIYLDNLPKLGKFVDWKNSIGYKIGFIYDKINGLLLIEGYIQDKQILKVKYLNNESYSIHTSALLKCKLGNLLGVYTKKHKYEIGQIIEDEKRKIIITSQTRAKVNNKNDKRYNYKCLKCGAEINNILETSLVNGNGCPCCRGLVVIKGINDVATTHPHLVKYFVNSEDAYNITYGSDKKSHLRCFECGYVKDMTIYNLNNQGYGCPKCSDGKSYPSKIMFNLLQQLDIDFGSEKSFNWCRFKIDEKIQKGIYDFYFEIRNQKYVIEVDGFQHKIGMMSMTSDKQIKIDTCKDILAKENNIEVIRVNCDKSNLDFIKNNILSSKLNKLFDLSNIDWLKCHEYACRSLIKEVCILWNECHDISKITLKTKSSKCSVRNYLKQGRKLNWCDYNPEIQIKNNHKKQRKKVEVFKNSISLGVFDSVCELERVSEELFGMKLLQSNVSQVCRLEKKIYNGYTFKYV